MRCSDVLERLSEYLYDELSAEQHQAIEEHCASCESCRRELESLHRTHRALDHYSPIEAPCDAAELAEFAAGDSVDREHGAGVSGILHRRPLWVGLAAGIAMFFGLVWLNARVEYDRGHLTVAFGRAPAATIEPGITLMRKPGELSVNPQFRRVVREELGANSTLTLTALQDYLHGWEIEQYRRQLVLIDTLRRIYEQDRQRMERDLHSFAQFTAEDTVRTWAAIDDVFHLATNPYPKPEIESPSGQEW